MSCALATPSAAELRIETIAARLRVHEWVRDARAFMLEGADRGDAGSVYVLVVPSADGLRVLRRRGKAYLVAAWERDLRDSGLTRDAGVAWHLVEELVTLVQTPSARSTQPDWMPIVSDLELDRSELALRCRLQVPYDLPIFRGHFPSVPIVPGVLQVGWAIELARAHGLAAGRCRGISMVKFRRIVQPGMCLAARLATGQQNRQLQFSYELDGTVVTTGRLQIEGENG